MAQGTTSEPGFLVVSATAGTPLPDPRRAVAAIGVTAGIDNAHPGLATAAWGGHTFTAPAVLLTKELRRRDAPVDAETVRRMLVGRDDVALTQMMPTFGAAVLVDGGASVCTDALGFRHVYLRAGTGWAAISTSARALAALAPTTLDLEAAAIQSLLGWQLRDRTLFAGVTKLPAGRLATIRDGQISVERFATTQASGRVEIADVVNSMTSVLRGYLSAYLDDHPDAVLQLTGGQDSRLLLSAIAMHRRRGLRVVTLGDEDSLDVAIAARLAQRYGMHHERLRLHDLSGMAGEEALQRCLRASGALELTADPIARAALDIAEETAEDGPRISGLGGEIARGFYYLGRGVLAPVTRARTRQLVDWRMFANEAVEAAALRPDFRDWARDFATNDVFGILRDTGRPWFEATDALYLEQRMQRWAGVTETAICSRQQVVNPMLDDRWIAAVTSLSPQDKARSLFLARLQVSLDDELASVPLDNRPPPRTYAERSWRSSVAQGGSSGKRIVRKLVQRGVGRRRPPLGGDAIAVAVVDQWRRAPELLASLADSPVIDSDWLSQLLAGERDAGPSTVGFLINQATAANLTRCSSAGPLGE